MQKHLKGYFNQLFTYIPVSIFILTVVFFITIMPTINDLKIEYGVDAIDVFIDLYILYFIRTLLLTLFIPIYGLVLSSSKFSYRKGMVIHFILINITVGVLYYRPGFGLQSLLIVLATSIIIYVTILLILIVREKQFINNANNIFKENKE